MIPNRSILDWLQESRGGIFYPLQELGGQCSAMTLLSSTNDLKNQLKIIPKESRQTIFQMYLN
jgi:hypothetical protein